MTAKELRDYFNNTFEYDHWPVTFEVDAETYGYVCHEVFTNAIEVQEIFNPNIILGIHSGIKFKGVELILKDKTNE